MDQKLFFLINRDWTGPVPDRFMAALSSLDFWIPPLLVLIVAVAVFGGFKARAMLATLIVTVAVTDGVVVHILKQWVNRPRPHQVEAARVVTLRKAFPATLGVFREPKVKISKPETGPIEGRSFPSGHTTNNFAVAVVLTAFFRRAWPYFLFAGAIGYSRIYTASHWPSDVALSAVLGTALGLVVVALSRAAWKRWAPGLLPGLYRRHPSLIETYAENPAQ